MQRKRRRDSVALSENGKLVVEEARLNKGWGKTSNEWCDFASTSLPTLKRFLRGRRISKDCFINLCRAVGIQEWYDLVALNDIDSTQAILPVGQNQNTPLEDTTPPSSVNVKLSFMMTGIFNENKRLEIEVALAHLKSHLLTCNVTIMPSENDYCLAVTGTFTKEARQQIEISLMHLQYLLSVCSITVLPKSES